MTYRHSFPLCCLVAHLSGRRADAAGVHATPSGGRANLKYSVLVKDQETHSVRRYRATAADSESHLWVSAVGVIHTLVSESSDDVRRP